MCGSVVSRENGTKEECSHSRVLCQSAAEPALEYESQLRTRYDSAFRKIVSFVVQETIGEDVLRDRVEDGDLFVNCSGSGASSSVSVGDDQRDWSLNNLFKSLSKNFESCFLGLLPYDVFFGRKNKCLTDKQIHVDGTRTKILDIAKEFEDQISKLMEIINTIMLDVKQRTFAVDREAKDRIVRSINFLKMNLGDMKGGDVAHKSKSETFNEISSYVSRTSQDKIIKSINHLRVVLDNMKRECVVHEFRLRTLSETSSYTALLIVLGSLRGGLKQETEDCKLIILNVCLSSRSLLGICAKLAELNWEELLFIKSLASHLYSEFSKSIDMYNWNKQDDNGHKLRMKRALTSCNSEYYPNRIRLYSAYVSRSESIESSDLMHDHVEPCGDPHDKHIRVTFIEALKKFYRNDSPTDPCEICPRYLDVLCSMVCISLVCCFHEKKMSFPAVESLKDERFMGHVGSLLYYIRSVLGMVPTRGKICYEEEDSRDEDFTAVFCRYEMVIVNRKHESYKVVPCLTSLGCTSKTEEDYHKLCKRLECIRGALVYLLRIYDTFNDIKEINIPHIILEFLELAVKKAFLGFGIGYEGYDDAVSKIIDRIGHVDVFRCYTKKEDALSRSEHPGLYMLSKLGIVSVPESRSRRAMRVFIVVWKKGKCFPHNRCLLYKGEKCSKTRQPAER